MLNLDQGPSSVRDEAFLKLHHVIWSFKKKYLKKPKLKFNDNAVKALLYEIIYY